MEEEIQIKVTEDRTHDPIFIINVVDKAAAIRVVARIKTKLQHARQNPEMYKGNSTTYSEVPYPADGRLPWESGT